MKRLVVLFISATVFWCTILRADNAVNVTVIPNLIGINIPDWTMDGQIDMADWAWEAWLADDGWQQPVSAATTIYAEPLRSLTNSADINCRVWLVYGSHHTRACCWEIWFEEWLAALVESVTLEPPYDWWPAAWLIVPEDSPVCANWGHASGAYPLGGMWNDFDGPMAVITFSEPVHPIGMMDHVCELVTYWDYKTVWWDGFIPNLQMPTVTWSEECKN